MTAPGTKVAADVTPTQSALKLTDPAVPSTEVKHDSPPEVKQDNKQEEEILSLRLIDQINELASFKLIAATLLEMDTLEADVRKEMGRGILHRRYQIVIGPEYTRNGVDPRDSRLKKHKDPTPEGATPLVAAVLKRLPVVVTMILAKREQKEGIKQVYANVDQVVELVTFDKGERRVKKTTALMLAVQMGEIKSIEALVRESKEPHLPDLLIEAVRTGDPLTIKELMKYRVTITQEIVDLALEQPNCVELIEALFAEPEKEQQEAKQDATKEKKAGDASEEKAVPEAHKKILTNALHAVLIKFKHEPNPPNPKLIEALVKYGAQVNENVKNEEVTPLMFIFNTWDIDVSTNKSFPLVAALFAGRVKPNLEVEETLDPPNLKLTPLQHLVNEPDVDIRLINLLIQHGANRAHPLPIDVTLISSSVAKGDTVLHLCLKRGAPLREKLTALLRLDEKLTAKELAAEVESRKTFIDAVNDKGQTALWMAVQQREFVTAELLLDAGANPSITPKEDLSALWYLVTSKNPPIGFVKKLCVRSKIDSRDMEYLLKLPELNEQKQVLDFLQKLRVSRGKLNVEAKAVKAEGDTKTDITEATWLEAQVFALLLATQNHWPNVIMDLVSNGVNSPKAFALALTTNPIDKATLQAFQENKEESKEGCHDIRRQYRYANTPVCLPDIKPEVFILPLVAVMKHGKNIKERLELMVDLLAGGADPLMVPDKHNETALHAAVELGVVDFVKTILSHAGPNAKKLQGAKDAEGRTPLLVAMTQKHLDMAMVRALVDPEQKYDAVSKEAKELGHQVTLIPGADVNIPDDKGNLPIVAAVDHLNAEAFLLLKQAGANLKCHPPLFERLIHQALKEKWKDKKDQFEKIAKALLKVTDFNKEFGNSTLIGCFLYEIGKKDIDFVHEFVLEIVGTNGSSPETGARPAISRENWLIILKFYGAKCNHQQFKELLRKVSDIKLLDKFRNNLRQQEIWMEPWRAIEFEKRWDELKRRNKLEENRVQYLFENFNKRPNTVTVNGAVKEVKVAPVVADLKDVPADAKQASAVTPAVTPVTLTAKNPTPQTAVENKTPQFRKLLEPERYFFCRRKMPNGGSDFSVSDINLPNGNCYILLEYPSGSDELRFYNYTSKQLEPLKIISTEVVSQLRSSGFVDKDTFIFNSIKFAEGFSALTDGTILTEQQLLIIKKMTGHLRADIDVPNFDQMYYQTYLSWQRTKNSSYLNTLVQEVIPQTTRFILDCVSDYSLFQRLNKDLLVDLLIMVTNVDLASSTRDISFTSLNKFIVWLNSENNLFSNIPPEVLAKFFLFMVKAGDRFEKFVQTDRIGSTANKLLPTIWQMLSQKNCWHLLLLPCDEKGKSVLYHLVRGDSPVWRTDNLIIQSQLAKAAPETLLEALELGDKEKVIPVQVKQYLDGWQLEKQKTTLLDVYFYIQRSKALLRVVPGEKDLEKSAQTIRQREIILLKMLSFYVDKETNENKDTAESKDAKLNRDTGDRAYLKDKWKVNVLNVIEMFTKDPNDTSVFCNKLKRLMTLQTKESKETVTNSDSTEEQQLLAQFSSQCHKFFTFLRQKGEIAGVLAGIAKIRQLDAEFESLHPDKMLTPEPTAMTRSATQAAIARSTKDGPGGTNPKAKNMLERFIDAVETAVSPGAIPIQFQFPHV